MTKQEAFLVNTDLGDSLDSVEALIKKHGDFEKSLAAQEEKIKVGRWNISLFFFVDDKLISKDIMVTHMTFACSCL